MFRGFEHSYRNALPGSCHRSNTAVSTDGTRRDGLSVLEGDRFGRKIPLLSKPGNLNAFYESAKN